MKNKFIVLAGLGVLLCLAVQACTIPGTNAVNPSGQPENTEAPIVTEAPVTEPDVTAPPTAVPVVSQIQHLTQPNTPAYIGTQSLRDCTLVDTTGVPVMPLKLVGGCDLPEVAMYERPFSTDFSTYMGYLDILSAQFGADTNWLYAKIEPVETVAKVGEGDLTYFLELDINADRLSDYIIAVTDLSPNAVVWTTDKVRAWKFENNGVNLVFDSGVGSDPDLAWARRNIYKDVEFGFKPALLDNKTTFAWWVWTYQGTLDPSQILPINGLPDQYQMDSSCAWGFNIDASGLTNFCW